MTFSKKMFDPLHPDTDLIEIGDIAHSLSMLCRANGHFTSFYSVAQHCVNCALEAKARGYSAKVQLACLLHDASEAYLSDVTRPVKEELPQYKEIEEPLQETIWNKWLPQPLNQQERAQVFSIDDDILAHEFLQLMQAQIIAPTPELFSRPEFAFIGFAHWENRFAELFYQLYPAQTSHAAAQ